MLVLNCEGVLMSNDIKKTFYVVFNQSLYKLCIYDKFSLQLLLLKLL